MRKESFRPELLKMWIKWKQSNRFIKQWTNLQIYNTAPV